MTMQVELIYATPREQNLLTLDVPDKTTVAHAIALSGILVNYPEIDLSQNKVGIFSKLVSLETQLKPGDRIEIYRALTLDPKQKRRLRAKSDK